MLQDPIQKYPAEAQGFSNTTELKLPRIEESNSHIGREKREMEPAGVFRRRADIRPSPGPVTFVVLAGWSLAPQWEEKAKTRNPEQA